jgi:transcriptional regulator with XRE-family HTH domain
MPTTTQGDLDRLAQIVIQRRVKLGWHKAEAASRSDLTHTTYMRVENAQTVRDITYSKIERAFGWAPGACLAILAGATEAQEVGDEYEGVRIAPAADLQDGVMAAVQNATLATRPGTSAQEMAEYAKAIVAELVKRGIIAATGKVK